MLTSLLLAFLIAQSQDAVAVSSSEAVNRAQAWLLAAYPALRRGNLAVHVYGDAETMRLEIVDEPSAQAPGPRAASPPALVVDLHATKDGRVEFVTARGPLVYSAESDNLKAQVAAHPGWMDGDIDAAIASVGGHYGPASSPAASAAVVSGVLRTAATATSSAFVRSDPRGPAWIVEVAGPTRSYQLAFEPLDGQLIGVTPK